MIINFGKHLVHISSFTQVNFSRQASCFEKEYCILFTPIFLPLSLSLFQSQFEMLKEAYSELYSSTTAFAPSLFVAGLYQDYSYGTRTELTEEITGRVL